MQQVREELVRIETQVRFLNDSYRQFTLTTRINVNKQLSEGQIHFYLKDYMRASIILLAIVQEKSFANSTQWLEAVYYLAESLMENQNVVGAKKYYQKLLKQGTLYLEETILRLMQIAAQNKQHSEMEHLFQRATYLPHNQKRDQIYYIYAKHLHEQGKFIQAQQLFRQITTSPEDHARALYFMAVIDLQTQNRKQSLPTAINQLKESLKQIPKPNKPQIQTLHDILLLSLGRLHLEQNQSDQAIQYYSRISRTSHVFDQALYEICWVYIKRAQKYEQLLEEKQKAGTYLEPAQENKLKQNQQTEYQRAFNTLDNLISLLPQSHFYTEAQLLRGRLQLHLATLQQGKIRSQQFNVALDSYQQIASAYRKIYEKMDQLLKERDDPQKFFNDLISQQIDQSIIASVLPKDVIQWMTSEELMSRTMIMLKDLRQMQDSLKDNHNIIKRLEKALKLDSEQIDLSPTLKDARMRGTSIRSSIIQLQTNLNAMLQRIVESNMAPADLEPYNRLQHKLKSLRSLYMRTPRNTQEMLQRSKNVQKRIEHLNTRLNGISIRINYAKQFLQTLHKWLFDNPEAQNLTTTQRNNIRSDANQLESMISKLWIEYNQLSNEIDLASIELGYASADAQEREIQEQYNRLILQERTFLDRIRGKLSSTEQKQLTEIDNFNQRLQASRTQIHEFFKRLFFSATQFRNQIKRDLDRETFALEQYQQKISNLEYQAKTQAAQIAHSSFLAVRQKFYDIVLSAEVGVIDVAWREKQTLQSDNKRLTQNRARELKVLEEEFRDLLQEIQ
jgi:hypothetical protein